MPRRWFHRVRWKALNTRAFWGVAVDEVAVDEVVVGVAAMAPTTASSTIPDGITNAIRLLLVTICSSPPKVQNPKVPGNFKFSLNRLDAGLPLPDFYKPLQPTMMLQQCQAITLDSGCR
jgi:hypothetical protein